MTEGTTESLDRFCSPMCRQTLTLGNNMKKRITESQPSDPLQKLLSMPPAERIKAVAEDVRTKTDEFRVIESHELAEAIGVPEIRRPTDTHWSFINYAWKQSLDEYAEGNDSGGLSELVFWIKDKVSAQRFQILVEKSAALEGYSPNPQFDFLTAEERRLVEEAIAVAQLESNIDNGICCVAQCDVSGPEGDLHFEAAIEDDGACVDLRTPYDRRDGRFLSLNDCVTDSDFPWLERHRRKEMKLTSLVSHARTNRG